MDALLVDFCGLDPVTSSKQPNTMTPKTKNINEVVVPELPLEKKFKHVYRWLPLPPEYVERATLDGTIEKHECGYVWDLSLEPCDNDCHTVWLR
jgi:hypothetical protein